VQPNWYVATLLFECNIENRSERLPTCDEQLRLVSAEDNEEALQKSLLLGNQEEVSYENVYGDVVSWRFLGLVELEEIDADSIGDGTEIKSRLLRCKEPKKRVHKKEDLTVYRWEREKREKSMHPIGS